MPKADPSAQPAASPPPSGLHAIKVKWSKKKTYSKEDISSIFSKFGEIDFVIMGEEKRKGRPNALISFKNPTSAVSYLHWCACASLCGIPTYPTLQQTAMDTKTDGFKASWPSKQPDVTPPPNPSPSSQQSTPFFSPFSNRASPFGTPFTSPNYKSPFASPFGTVPSQKAASSADLEDLEMQTLMRLQRAAKLQKQEQEQKSTPTPQESSQATPTQQTPDKANSKADTPSDGNTSYFHPLNFNSPPPPEKQPSASTTPTGNNNSYNYFQPTDFESMEERKLRQAAERQKLMEEMAAQSGNTVNS